MQAILLVLALGFPLALFLAWAFEMTPEGIKRDEDVDRSAPRGGRPAPPRRRRGPSSGPRAGNPAQVPRLTARPGPAVNGQG
jgi:hypothetical protein